MSRGKTVAGIFAFISISALCFIGWWKLTTVSRFNPNENSRAALGLPKPNYPPEEIIVYSSQLNDNCSVNSYRYTRLISNIIPIAKVNTNQTDIPEKAQTVIDMFLKKNQSIDDWFLSDTWAKHRDKFVKPDKIISGYLVYYDEEGSILVWKFTAKINSYQTPVDLDKQQIFGDTKIYPGEFLILCR